MAERGRPEEYTDERIVEINKALKVYIQKTKIPLWSEFCYKHGINRRNASAFCKRSQDFQDTYSMLQAKEDAGLIRHTLSRKANSANAKIAALVLTTRHDYHEKEMIDAKMDQTVFLADVVRKANERRKKKQEAQGG